MSQEDSEAGPLSRFLAEDHRRLDALLQSAAAQPAQVNREVYDQFRASITARWPRCSCPLPPLRF